MFLAIFFIVSTWKHYHYSVILIITSFFAVFEHKFSIKSLQQRTSSWFSIFGCFSVFFSLPSSFFVFVVAVKTSFKSFEVIYRFVVSRTKSPTLTATTVHCSSCTYLQQFSIYFASISSICSKSLKCFYCSYCSCSINTSFCFLSSSWFLLVFLWLFIYTL